MQNSLLYPLTAIVAFLVGGIPFGFFIGKFRGIDVRTQGSGNIGATNVGRCCGKPWGIFCFILDFCKGGLPVWIAMALARERGLNPDLVGVLAAVAAVCGHMFTPYLKFKGGKGIATSAGALFMLAPYAILVALLVWALTLALWRYVSLSSILAAAVLPFAAWGVRLALHKDVPSNTVIAILGMISALAIYRHKANISRLLNGTENRLGATRPAAQEERNESSRSQ